jgi:hypothetical protein
VTQPDPPAGERLLLLPASAWVGHVAGSYALAGLHCHRHFLEGEVASIDSIRFALLALTVLAGTIVVFAGLRAAVSWRLLRNDERGDPNGRQAFSYALAAALSALALLYLLWSLAPTLFGDTCA